MQNSPSPIIVESFILNEDNKLPNTEYLKLHRNRFFESVMLIAEKLQINFSSADIGNLKNFWKWALAELSNFNRPAFPRISCSFESGSPVFEILYRPSPSITDSVDFIDTKNLNNTQINADYASFKGPNIDIHRDLINEHGGEILLLDENRCVLEGTTTSLVWWQDDVLYSVPKSDKRVSSITEDLVIRIANSFLVKTHTQLLTPEKLQDKSVWALNALHGIRKVRQINGKALPGSNELMLKRFNDAYEKIKML